MANKQFGQFVWPIHSGSELSFSLLGFNGTRFQYWTFFPFFQAQKRRGSRDPRGRGFWTQCAAGRRAAAFSGPKRLGL